MVEWAQIRSPYSKTSEFISQVERWLRADCRPFYGFKLLNAPPVLRPDFFSIGYQPGGGEDAYEYELALGSDRHWPCEPEFVTADWHLARQMQEIFPRSGLARSMGSNVVFLR
jgi:hypothetical protein